MGWQYSNFFKTICRVVLITFYFQTLHVGNLGYRSGEWGLSWQLGFNEAAADDSAQPPAPPAPQPQSLAPDDYLSPTPDANSADPYIIQKAQELGNNPAQIFAFVRDEIGYESYKGSLRGARGTLWSKAGNSLDKASLMIALLRASNIPARYVTGTLNNADAQKLILSMFSSPLRIVGCINPGTQVSDPANDPKLLAESKDHYWVEYGNSFETADPSFEKAAVGQAFADIQNKFNEVPDNLRHKVNIRLKRELTLPLSGLFSGGSSQDIATVLDQTVNTVDVVGKPLTIGHFISSSSIGAIFTQTTNTYSPYLILGNDSLDFSQDTLISGQDYQETLTNFPLASQIATGLFLEMDVIAADGSVRTYERTLADRIGIAARQNGGGASLSVDTNQQTFVSLLDLTTISILPGKFDPAVFDAKNEEMRQLASEFTNLPQFDPGSTIDLSDEVVQSGMMQLFQRSFIATSRLRLALYEDVSDNANARLSTPAMVMAYHDSPRLTLFQTRVEQAEDKSFSVNFQIDLRKYDIRTIAAPGQNPSAQIGFSLQKGLINTSLESDIMTFPTNFNDLQIKSVSAQSIWNEVLSQGIATTFLTPDDTTTLSTLDINPDAVALISNAQRSGKGIITPNKSVLVDGKMRLAWFEMDLVTGELIGVLDDGSHGFLDTVGVYLSKIAQKIKLEGGLGFLTAVIGSSAFHLIKTIFFSIIAHVDRYKDLAFWKNQYSIIRSELLLALDVIAKKVSFFFYAGYQAGLAFAYFNLNDPPLDNLQISPPPLGTLNIPNNQPSLVAADIARDNLFTLPLNGAELPTMFRVGIKNSGTTADTFSLNLTDIPAGFTAQTSIQQIAIPPGETAEVGVCLRPSSGLPAPNEQASFEVKITSANDSNVTTIAAENFIIPEIHGVIITSDQPSYSGIPGNPVTVNLTVKSAGNMPENTTLSVQVPAGLNASPLNDATLDAGGSASQALVLTPNADVPLNTTLTATVTATFGSASTTQTQILQIPVFVAAPGAQAIADASVSVSQLGKADLANRLNDLSMAMNRLVQNADDQVAKSQALAALNSIIAQLTADPFLSEFVDEFTAAKLALEAAGTPDEMLTALNGLGTSINAFGTTATQLGLHNFEASLSPASIEAQPNVPATIDVRIRNTGSDETTYNLSFENLPADTSGAFNQTSVTLLPGQLSNNLTGSLTRTAGNELLPASFSVRVTAEQAPAVTRLIEGNLTVRNEFVSVASVSASPSFVNPKVTPPLLMFISAKILNAVNRARNALVSFKVKNSNGQEVFASSPVNTALSVQTALTDVALGAFNPQGIPEGTYTIEVSVTDADGAPIPGGTGTGNLLLGSPVTASLSNDPDKLPPGAGSVSNTLNIKSQLILPPLSVVGQAQIPNSNARSGVAVKDNIAYVCSGNGIQLFDVADPGLPHWLKSVGSGVNIGCKIQGDLLLSLQPTNGGYSAHLLHVYSINSDPLNPVLLGTSTPINYGLQYDLSSNAGGAFIAQFEWCNILGNNDIYIQTGDLLSVPFNLDNTVNPTSASPALSDVLFNTHGDLSNDGTDVPGCPANGGDGNVWQLAVVDENTLLMATTTIKGTDTQSGIGRVLVIDISDRANLSILKEVLIPDIAHVTGIAVDGDHRALIVSSTGGWRDFFSNSDPNNDPLLTGNLVFSTLLLTDPRNPILLASQSISRQSRTFWNGGLTALGNGRFAYSSLGGVNDSKQILMIDANDPFNLVFGQTNVPAENIGPNAITANGDLIYTTNTAGDLIIYKLPDLPVIPVKASAKVPNNTGVTIDTGSFTEAPSEIIPGSGFDTLVWERNLTAGSSLSLNWQTLIDNLQPGEARQTSQGGIVDFTFENTTGQVPLSPTTVVSEQLLTLDPATQTVHPGATALYNLTVKNPAASLVSYALSIQGIPASWLQLDTPLLLEANEERTIGLTIAVEPFTPTGLRSLVITAQGDNGARGAVQGDLLIEGDAVIPAADINAHGVIMALTPANATAGQGTSARYTVRVINTGSSAETYRLDTTLLPANFVSAFDSAVITVPPGASNFRDIGLTVTPPADTPPTDYPFSVQAVFDANNEVGTTSHGLLTVVNAGVSLAFNQVTGNPGETLSLNITNTGTIEDEFMLSLLGPGGLISSLSDPSVRLLPGAVATVGVTLGNVDFALPGGLSLFARATSVYDSAVQAISRANISVAESKGLSVSLDPAVVELTAPGAKNFLIKVKNTGNVEDAYSATISQVTGPVSASLEGLDGNPAQTIPVFRLPALADGSLNLGLSLNTAGTGIVKVLIASNTEPSIQQELTAQLGLAETNRAPIADAGQNKNVFTGVPSTVDGSASSDPDGNLISYRWRFVSVPAGSILVDDSIVNNQTSAPLITPDVAGIYRLELIVSDGLLDSLPAYVELTAANANVPPNAVAGQNQTVSVGETVALDGSLSHDPDGGPAPLSFNWSFTSIPELSGLGNEQISSDPQHPAKAFFTPDVKGAYELKLRVSDGEAFGDDTLTVTATLANVPPVANAGADQVIQLGNVVNLNAELSSDPDLSPSPLSFSWKFVSLPEKSGLTNSAIIADSQKPARASFTPDQTGDYVLEVDVSDGEAVSSDNIMVRVLPALRYQDISDLFRITPSSERTVLNRQTRKLTSSVKLTLTNISALDINTPIRVIFGLSSSAVSIPGAAIDQNSGQRYLELPGNLLQPGGTEILEVQFVYPAGTQFSYDSKVFGTVAR